MGGKSANRKKRRKNQLKFARNSLTWMSKNLQWSIKNGSVPVWNIEASCQHRNNNLMFTCGQINYVYSAVLISNPVVAFDESLWQAEKEDYNPYKSTKRISREKTNVTRVLTCPRLTACVVNEFSLMKTSKLISEYPISGFIASILHYS